LSAGQAVDRGVRVVDDEKTLRVRATENDEAVCIAGS